MKTKRDKHVSHFAVDGLRPIFMLTGNFSEKYYFLQEKIVNIFFSFSINIWGRMKVGL